MPIDRIITASIQDGAVIPADLSTGGPSWDTSGNVGIGTSSPGARLDVVGDGLFQNPSGNRNIAIRSSAGNGSFISLASNGNAAFTNSFDIFQSSNGDGSLNNKNGPIIFLTGTGNTSAERTRIDTNGNFIVATGGSSITAGGGTPRFSMNYSSNTGPGYTIQDTTPQNGNTFIRFVNAGTVAGQITTNGGTTTSYSSASDYRLKENVQPMTGALAKVSALNPVTYKWKIDGADGQGFIAHELAEVCPDAVVGEKDAVNEDGSIKPQGIDTSFLVATLTAAIQEQQQMIETLQAKVAALEAK